MINKAIVLDANILIRAVLGKRVRELIFTNASTVKFFAPDVAYADARKYLPALFGWSLWLATKLIGWIKWAGTALRPVATGAALCWPKKRSASLVEDGSRFYGEANEAGRVGEATRIMA